MLTRSKLAEPTEVVWTPPPFRETNCGQLVTDMPSINSYETLYQWSIAEPDLFWERIVMTQGVNFKGEPIAKVGAGEPMWPRPNWFPGVTLNFTENLISNLDPTHPATLHIQENVEPKIMTAAQLSAKVSALAQWLREKGIKKGDVVAGVLTNSPEAIIGLLATASLGGVWTVCSPDSGSQFITDRFAQTRPKILITMSGYYYNSEYFSLSEKNEALILGLPSVAHVVVVKTYFSSQVELKSNETSLEDIFETQASAPIVYEQVDFSDPLYILFSSGTTGKPKAIVHSVGGALLQHIKEHRLQCDLKPKDRLLYYTTTSWMMWHWMVSGLASHLTLVLFDAKPDPEVLWTAVEEHRVQAFGTSAPWLSICQKTKLKRNSEDLNALKLILSTGAPLLREQFDYIYQEIKSDVQVASISGGTDIVSCFAGAGPVVVQRGKLQCLGLGMKVEVWNEMGQPIQNHPGELVCTQPFPAMPIYFLDDPDGAKYREAYFDKYPNIWAHGDDAIWYDDNALEILGRSDTTIKRNGVRIGTSDIYNALTSHPDIEDALAVGKRMGDNEQIWLFIKCKETKKCDATMSKEIRKRITAQSIWLKPDKIHQVADIPYTSNGKKSEQLIKNLLNGKPITNLSSIRNPECLAEYEKLTS